MKSEAGDDNLMLFAYRFKYWWALETNNLGWVADINTPPTLLAYGTGLTGSENGYRIRIVVKNQENDLKERRIILMRQRGVASYINISNTSAALKTLNSPFLVGLRDTTDYAGRIGSSIPTGWISNNNGQFESASFKHASTRTWSGTNAHLEIELVFKIDGNAVGDGESINIRPYIFQGGSARPFLGANPYPQTASFIVKKELGDPIDAKQIHFKKVSLPSVFVDFGSRRSVEMEAVSKRAVELEIKSLPSISFHARSAPSVIVSPELH